MRSTWEQQLLQKVNPIIFTLKRASIAEFHIQMIASSEAVRQWQWSSQAQVMVIPSFLLSVKCRLCFRKAKVKVSLACIGHLIDIFLLHSTLRRKASLDHPVSGWREIERERRQKSKQAQWHRVGDWTNRKSEKMLSGQKPENVAAIIN